ncbi:MAG: hypothetical protein LBU32_27885 [Clostridiales bacterium]|jgi:hypothetical protein|nr:hypothetical protein [Clostridiales bacterium]
MDESVEIVGDIHALLAAKRQRWRNVLPPVMDESCAFSQECQPSGKLSLEDLRSLAIKCRLMPYIQHMRELE